MVSNQHSDVSAVEKFSSPSLQEEGEQSSHSHGTKSELSRPSPSLVRSTSGTAAQLPKLSGLHEQQASAGAIKKTEASGPQREQFKISTFYHFTDLADYKDWQPMLKEAMQAQGVRGSILLAAEGINATIAGPEAGVEAVLKLLRADERFADLFVKESQDTHMPFTRAKVRLKKETITLGQPADAACITGTQVPPEEWNALLDDPQVRVLDTRNTYETHLGSFEGAEIWPLEDFQQIADKVRNQLDKSQKIAMFCTGGVRCEKLSSWMMQEGYTDLYQLEGGIVHYLNRIPPEESKWQGTCFVFDERIALTHGCKVAKDISMCPSCGHPLTPEDRTHPHYLPAIHCRFCS